MLKWINRLTCTAVQFADDGTEKLIPKMSVPAFMSIQDGCYCPSCVTLRVIVNSNCWRCSSSIGINRCYEVEAYVIGGTVPPIFGKRIECKKRRRAICHHFQKTASDFSTVSELLGDLMQCPDCGSGDLICVDDYYDCLECGAICISPRDVIYENGDSVCE